MYILLISTYELGHQPFNLALLASHLLQAGHQVQCLDLAVQGFEAEKVRRAEFIGISAPMHTALRLGFLTARRVRQINPAAHINFYGLYAGLNASYLLDTVADSAVGGEYEQALVTLVNAITQGDSGVIAGVERPAASGGTHFPRQKFIVPTRHLLPPLSQYARLAINGEQRLAGYVEASRGCAHKCRHCPITPVYDGRLRILQQDTVLADIEQLVRMGAQHITFGDPDFLNGVKHSLRIVREMRACWSDLTFDFTAKIEHILEYQQLMPEFSRLGCVFILSAVESLNDGILVILDKGHSRADVEKALEITRSAGIPLRPSLMPFTPWATRQDIIELIDFVEKHGLIAHIAPVQFSIRLLLPPGSPLLALPKTQPHLQDFDEEKFTFLWKHPDPAMDRLQKAVATCVETAANAGENIYETFAKIRELGYRASGRRPIPQIDYPSSARMLPPRLTEDWFC
ncbi:CUAEP/CCAEP-tail radical SAM protein [candidate division KSB1 bacterium]|nr:CUAEP/CCAEP-tail radical SAM protein [candidate division KSB1 bacterium]